MAIVDKWTYSLASRLVAFTLLATILLLIAAAVRSLNLAEPLATNSSAATAAAPTVSTVISPGSCTVVTIEAIFKEDHIQEVIDQGRNVGLAVETYQQSSKITVAFVRYSSDGERDQILSTAKGAGWADAYLSTLKPADC